MTSQEHKAQGHESCFVACTICWASFTFDAASTASPVTHAEQRGMERAWERVEATMPPASGLCRQCGTRCYGDCSANA